MPSSHPGVCGCRWVKATGTIRLDPDSIPLGKVVRTYAPLNNKCMELRKVGPLPLNTRIHPAAALPVLFLTDCTFLLGVETV